MWPAGRSRASDMFLLQNHLLRHVADHPIPLQRHVPRTEPPTATCGRPSDPAPATCSSHRTTYCDMWLAIRSRSSDMFLAQNHLLRHVAGHPIPLQRHVRRAEPPTAACGGRPAPLQRHVPRAGPPTATCGRPADPAPATCSSQHPRLRTSARSPGGGLQTGTHGARPAGRGPFMGSNSEPRTVPQIRSEPPDSTGTLKRLREPVFDVLYGGYGGRSATPGIPPPAEGVGFEPTVPLPVHQLSGLANSATLAPLRVPAEPGNATANRGGSGGRQR